jgi:hypothetical protein
MKLKFMLLILWLFVPMHTQSTQPRYSINPTPLQTLYTPDSILNRKENVKVLYAGTRKRYSTCTGAAWFHENYLAVLNLHGKKIETYQFNADTLTCTPLQK